MSEIALSVRDLSKCYRIGVRRKDRADTLVAQLGEWIAARFQRRRNDLPEGAGIHWALKDLNFDVHEGEVVGIIGHNGAGKSTLLKILSRITPPTSGIARVRGSLASLLEVGTGFHPDLSGRDNVYMNAAILGMSRQQIASRFDDIVAFSGVEEYLDTPIKHYSSGMKVRLAFAVAAHLDPEVLIIDEVLAVGDAEFQKKCLNRIEDASSSGRTILFVSHNLSAVARLCSRVIVMNHGQLVFDGGALEGIRMYEESLGGLRSRRVWTDPAQRPGDEVVRLQSVELFEADRAISGPVNVRSPITVRMRYEVLTAGQCIMPSLHLFDLGGTAILSAVDTSPDWHARPRPAGLYESVVILPGDWFNEGQFSLSVALSTVEPHHNHLFAYDAVQFSTYDKLDGSSASGRHRERLSGYLRPFLAWNTQRN